MYAKDALKILSSHPAVSGAIGGGITGGLGATIYNSYSQPTLDSYGNTIESNDINPLVAALGGAAIGAVSGYGYGKMSQPVPTDKPVQGMSAGTSPQPRQSSDINIDIDTKPQPIVQVVPANPMQPQQPMSPPGMRTVMVQPIKEPEQEMMEEALRLKELAAQQQQQRQQQKGWGSITPQSNDEHFLEINSDDARYQDWLLLKAIEAQKKIA